MVFSHARASCRTSLALSKAVSTTSSGSSPSCTMFNPSFGVEQLSAQGGRLSEHVPSSGPHPFSQLMCTRRPPVQDTKQGQSSERAQLWPCWAILALQVALGLLASSPPAQIWAAPASITMPQHPQLETQAWTKRSSARATSGGGKVADTARNWRDLSLVRRNHSARSPSSLNPHARGRGLREHELCYRRYVRPRPSNQNEHRSEQQPC